MDFLSLHERFDVSRLASLDEIYDLEGFLGFSIPQDYSLFLRKCGSGFFSESEVIYEIDDDGQVAVDVFLNITDQSPSLKSRWKLDDFDKNDRLLTFAENVMGTSFLISALDPYNVYIYKTYMGAESLNFLCRGFSAFINGLRIRSGS